MVAHLRQQDTKASLWLLDSLVELIDCLMFQHPGFPDLYEPVVDALKVSKIPFCRCCTGSEEGFAVFNGYSDCLHLIIIIITSGQRTLTRGHFAYCVVIEDQYCY